MNIDINFIAILMLTLPFIFSFANIYFLYSFKRKLKEEVLSKHFDLISKELSLIEKNALLTDGKVALNSAKVDALEKVLAAILSSGGGYNPNDDMMH